MVLNYIGYAVLTILSALVVAAEMATYSTRRERLLQMADTGNRNARMALIYLRAPNWYLAGSQLAMTLCSTTAGLMSSALFSEPLHQWMLAQGIAVQYAKPGAFWGTTLGLTLLITIFVNLLPKRFAFAYADSVAVFFAQVAWYWIKFTRPLLALLNWTVDLLGKLFKIRTTTTTEVTELDVLTILREGRRDRLIDPHEYEIVKNALALSDKRVTEVMTPRDAIRWIDLKAKDATRVEDALRCGRSQVPVSRGNLDEVIGYVRVRELLAKTPSPTRLDIETALKPVVRVPKTATALHVLNTLRQSRARLAFVSDDHGHILGLISLNDLVEVVLGEMESIRD